MMAENQEIILEKDTATFPSPILVFGFIHKAIREELLRLRLDVTVSCTVPELQQISGRYAFIRFITKHHVAALEEFIYPALDMKMRNSDFGCLVEHQNDDFLFNQLFEMLNSCTYSNEEECLLLSKGLACHTEKIFSSLNQYLINEERQIIPLLSGLFSFGEQASLMWHYMYSIPVVLMEKFLPWITSFLSSKERNLMLNCMQQIVPEEKLLQEVVSMWLEGRGCQGRLESFVAHDTNQTTNGLDELWYIEAASALTKKGTQGSKVTKLTTTMCRKLLVPECGLFKQDVQNLLKTQLIKIIYWKKALEMELKEIVEEAHKLRHSGDNSNMPSFVDRLHFIMELCVFHSALKDNALVQAIDWKVRKCDSIFNGQMTKESSTKDAQNIISSITHAESGLNSYEVFYQFCMQLDMLIDYAKKILFDKPEASSVAPTEVCIDEERNLFYQSLCMMPLRSIEHVLPWLYDRLSSQDAKEMLQNIHLAAPVADEPLVRLFTKWACKGSSEHCSALRRNFISWNDEIAIDKSRYPGTASDKQGDAFGHRDMYKRPRKRPHSSINEVKSFADGSSISEETVGNQLDQLANVQQPSIINNTKSATGNPTNPILCSHLKGKMLVSSNLHNMDYSEHGRPGNHALMPIDIIFLCHKAIRQDLHYLDASFTKLRGFNVKILHDVNEKFHLFKDLYEAHSEAEDKFVFPALAANKFVHDATYSYTEKHKQGKTLLESISDLLFELTKVHNDLVEDASFLTSDMKDLLLRDQMEKFYRVSANLQAIFKHLRVTVEQHLEYEDQKLWPLFASHLSIDEQNKIIGHIIGSTGAETLQKVLLWVTASLTREEQDFMFCTLRQITKNTMFMDWLNSWWEKSAKASTSSPSMLESTGLPYSGTVESLQIVAEYLYSRSERIPSRHTESNTSVQPIWKNLLRLNTEELEAALRKISNDDSLDSHKKAYFMQTLMAREWIVSRQQLPPTERHELLENKNKCPSYRDESKSIFGCEHYKRNCKIIADCCGKLFPCRQCHDKVSDHIMDRRATKEMMCMNCLSIQPIGPKCALPSCKGLQMARYFCNICKFFEDEKKVYHCPFCNICRVGQGLGIDYFHCMKCNACMALSLLEHKCREKDFESNCPICHDFMFTSIKTVKALPCGHSMHSACFKDYTCSHYKCPICSKSMGDMTVYFGMLDALLAAEELPEEYRGRKQDIYCNDCEKKGTVPFHWLYHKCTTCGSYNTRLINKGRDNVQ